MLIYPFYRGTDGLQAVSYECWKFASTGYTFSSVDRRTVHLLYIQRSKSTLVRITSVRPWSIS